MHTAMSQPLVQETQAENSLGQFDINPIGESYPALRRKSKSRALPVALYQEV